MGLTFRNNYEALSRDTKIDFISNPDIISQEANAILSAAWFWHTNNLNRWADRDDTDGVADVINIGRKTNTIGDANGYADRKKHVDHYKKIFK
jgi:putative chitinase